jgi:hypothetical protein
MENKIFRVQQRKKEAKERAARLEFKKSKQIAEVNPFVLDASESTAGNVAEFCELLNLNFDKFLESNVDLSLPIVCRFPLRYFDNSIFNETLVLDEKRFPYQAAFIMSSDIDSTSNSIRMRSIGEWIPCLVRSVTNTGFCINY